MLSEEKEKTIQLDIEIENLNNGLTESEREAAEQILKILCKKEIPLNSINTILDTCEKLISSSAFLNDFESESVQQVTTVLIDSNMKLNSVMSILNTCRFILKFNPTVNFKIS